MDLAILVNNTRICCKGRVLAIEEFRHKVQARLLLAHASDSEYRKLLDYLHTLSRGTFQKRVILGLFILSTYIAYLAIRTYFF